LYIGPPIIPYPPYSFSSLETMMQWAGTDTGSAAVPEPSTMALIALVAASVSAVRSRHRSRTGTKVYFISSPGICRPRVPQVAYASR
jgi:hypothetical protein